MTDPTTIPTETTVKNPASSVTADELVCLRLRFTAARPITAAAH